MIASWPYCRPVDEELIAHWKTLGADWQPQHMLVAYKGGKARAFVHGERRGDQHNILLLAMLPGAVEETVALIEDAERAARAEGVTRLCGPHWRSARYYAGYVLGNEPYHPHWANDGTEAFVRAGFRISHPALILVADAGSASPPTGSVAEGYEIIEANTADEFGAKPFRLAAMHDGREVATCGARLFPRLMSPKGGPVGQLGYIGTDEAHQGKGLATEMTRMSLKRLRDMGASEVLIATGLDNYPALRAYEKAGFSRRYNINEWSKKLE